MLVFVQIRRVYHRSVVIFTTSYWFVWLIVIILNVQNKLLPSTTLLLRSWEVYYLEFTACKKKEFLFKCWIDLDIKWEKPCHFLSQTITILWGFRIASWIGISFITQITGTDCLGIINITSSMKSTFGHTTWIIWTY